MFKIGDLAIFNVAGNFNGSRWGLGPGTIVRVIDIRHSVYANDTVYDILSPDGVKMHGFGAEWLTEPVEEEF